MLNPAEVTETWDRIKGFITTREAEISHEEQWGTRRLAYPIRKGQNQFLEGSYHLTRFATEQPFNRELETFLKVDDEVIRSMVTVTLPEEELLSESKKLGAPYELVRMVASDGRLPVPNFSAPTSTASGKACRPSSRWISRRAKARSLRSVGNLRSLPMGRP